MWSPIPVLELELTQPVAAPAEALDQCRQVKALMKWRGTPVGWMPISVVGSRLDAESLVESVLDHHLEIVTRWALSDALKAGLPPGEDVIDQALQRGTTRSSRACRNSRCWSVRESGPTISGGVSTPCRPVSPSRSRSSSSTTLPSAARPSRSSRSFRTSATAASRGRASTGREIAASWTRGVTWSRSSMTTSWSMSVGQACCSRRSLASRPWVPSPA